MAGLTDSRVRALKPRERPYKAADGQGLYVLVNPHGSKLWRFKYRWMGREKLLSLGSYPEIGLADARHLRDEARGQVAHGGDPAELRKARREEEVAGARETFAKIADELLEKKRREGKAAATLAKTEWLHRILCADLGSMPIPKITARNVLAPLRKVEARGNFETASRLRSAAGAIFRFAIASGRADNDPTYGLKDALVRPQVQHRAALTDPDQFGALLRAIDGFEGQPTTRIAFQVIALTAVRPGELRYAEWCEINCGERLWTIPASRTKMRRPHSVPLADQTLALLDVLRPLTGWGRFLFPSIRSSRRPISENTLNAALRRIGYGLPRLGGPVSILVHDGSGWSAP